MEELPRPPVDPAQRIEVLALDRAEQVGHLLGRIGEGIEPGIVLDIDVLELGGTMLQPDDAPYLQRSGAAIEGRDRDRIAEDVLQPPQIGSRWLDIEPGLDQMLVVTLAWPHHDAMFAERHRLAIRIGRDVRERQKGHRAIVA